MKAIWKRFGWGLVALAFAVIVAYVVCYLEDSNRQAKVNYEVAYQAAPVTVTVTNLTGNRRTNMDLPNWVSYLFTSDTIMGSYLKDVEQIASHEVNYEECAYYEYQIVGISYPTAQMLDPHKGGSVTFYPGYDQSVLLGDEYVCLIPVWLEAEIGENGTVTVSLECYHESLQMEHIQEFEFTVVGTFDTLLGEEDEEIFYCPFGTMSRIHSRMGCELLIDSITAVLIDNYRLEEFQEEAYSWLAPADPTGEKREFNRLGYKYYPYALDVDTSTLERISASLQITLAINAFSAMLVFALSAGAGFFLGFLMIRSRKREIILMRTLGRANGSIYVSYALEQMLCIAAGTALGGMAFQWQPMDRLGIFLGIYFVGLSAALILFLNSKLLTTIKEDG